MKPLVSYYGGKQRISSRIVERIEAISHKIYAEPFCGGCAVLYAKPARKLRNKDNYREAINDVNELIVNLYRVARNNPEALLNMLKYTPYSRVEHERAVAICKGNIEAFDIERAWATYVNAQMSFSNKLNAGWGTGKVSENQAATWAAKRDRLEKALGRLSSVHIDCQDALSFIDQWDHPDTLFYCDPPYPGTKQGHYSGYAMADYQALCDKLDNIQGSYILSNYPQAVEPSSAQQVIEIAATCSASGKGKTRLSKTKAAQGENERTEVLLICDRNPIKFKQQLSLLGLSC